MLTRLFKKLAARRSDGPGAATALFRSEFARFEGKIEAGEYDPAQALLAQLDSGGPAAAWITFGNALLDLKQDRRAESRRRLDAAVRDADGDCDLLYRIGWAYAQHDCVEQAETALLLASKRPEPYFEALRALGELYMKQRKFDQALVTFGRVLQLSPQSASAFYSVGAVFSAQGDKIQALACFQRAIAIEPTLVHAYVAGALAAFALMDAAVAEELLVKALEVDPAHEQARLCLGVARIKRGDVAGARAIFDELSNSPEMAYGALVDAGTVAMAIDNVAEGVALFRAARDLKPQQALAYGNLGAVSRAQEHFEEAIAYFQTALTLDPANDGGAAMLGMALLTTGQFAEGWDLYERRFAAHPQNYIEVQHAAMPGYWKGEDLAGKTIVVWREQGMGDEMQFVRYIPLLVEQGAQIVLECSEPLERLFRSLSADIQIVTGGAEWPPYDYHCPIVSLPRLFGTTIDSIPTRIPYLHAEPQLSKEWASRLPGDDRMRVGLVWSGGAHKGFYDFVNNLNRHRGMKLAELAPLFELDGVQYVSLQKGEAVDELQGFAKRDDILQFDAELSDFAQTAALVAQLDLVISVDTSVVHLAGALGKPVWVLSRLGGCWRWLAQGQDSPWYPQARVFRQKKLACWSPVVDEVVEALRTRIQGWQAAKT